MLDLKKDASKVMLRAWNTVWKSLLVDITYTRSLEGTTANPNNTQNASLPTYNPVTEEWTYPIGQSAETLTTTVKALKRDTKRDAWKDPELFVTDFKFTIKQSDFKATFTTGSPFVSDIVRFNGTDYRLAKWEGDDGDIFYHLYLRGI